MPAGQVLIGRPEEATANSLARSEDANLLNISMILHPMKSFKLFSRMSRAGIVILIG